MRRRISLKSKAWARRFERELTRRRILAVPNAPLVLTVLAALVVERPRHPDAKRQRTRKQRDVALWNARRRAERAA